MGRSRRGVAAEMPAFGAQSERAIGARGEEFLEHMGEQGNEGGAVGRRQAREHGIGDDVGCPSEQDRKSVGEGKRVSERVDLGGRMHIKKTKLIKIGTKEKYI